MTGCIVGGHPNHALLHPFCDLHLVIKKRNDVQRLLEDNYMPLKPSRDDNTESSTLAHFPDLKKVDDGFWSMFLFVYKIMSPAPEAILY